jgi:hypothetical protein
MSTQLLEPVMGMMPAGWIDRQACAAWRGCTPAPGRNGPRPCPAENNP